MNIKHLISFAFATTLLVGLAAGAPTLGRSGGDLPSDCDLLPGTVCSWGDDVSGQLGNGGLDGDSQVPTQVDGLSNVIAIAAGVEHNLALLSNGTLRAWGYDGQGQLGNGEPLSDQQAPVGVTGFANPSDPDVIAIAAGYSHSLALLADGTLRAWGLDTSGQLGNGIDAAVKPTPVTVVGFSDPSDPDVIAIAAGENHSLALLADGTLRAWGYDDQGQLGDGGANANQIEPVPVSGFDDPSDPDVVAIAGGSNHSLALLADGTLRAWGDDAAGQLGNGGLFADRLVPVAVSGFANPSDPNVVAIGVGDRHSLALLADGTLRAWGSDEAGQLGDGEPKANQGAPVAVSGLGSPSDPNVVAIGSGPWGFQSMAVLADGTMRIWGDDCCGQLGNGSGDNTTKQSPITLNGIAGVGAAGAGYYHSIVLGVGCFGEPATRLGTPRNDTISGGAGRQVIAGLGGNDRLSGGDGNDVLCGGDGNDSLNGGDGNDSLSGGAGVDTVKYPGGSAVTVNLNTGANNKGDTLSGIENVKGSNAADTVTGNNGANKLEGLKGDDDLSGLNGKDNLLGGAGNDTLSGGKNADTCNGGSGFDTATPSCESTPGVP